MHRYRNSVQCFNKRQVQRLCSRLFVIFVFLFPKHLWYSIMTPLTRNQVLQYMVWQTSQSGSITLKLKWKWLTPSAPVPDNQTTQHSSVYSHLKSFNPSIINRLHKIIWYFYSQIFWVQNGTRPSKWFRCYLRNYGSTINKQPCFYLIDTDLLTYVLPLP